MKRATGSVSHNAMSAKPLVSHTNNRASARRAKAQTSSTRLTPHCQAPAIAPGIEKLAGCGLTATEAKPHTNPVAKSARTHFAEDHRSAKRASGAPNPCNLDALSAVRTLTLMTASVATPPVARDASTMVSLVSESTF